MERELKEASRKDEEKESDVEDDGSSPEETREGTEDGCQEDSAADTVTTGLKDLSLSGTKKEQEEEEAVVTSQDFNPSSDERRKRFILNDPVISEEDEESEKSSSILSPRYPPVSNLMSSRPMMDSKVSQKENVDDESDIKDQECSGHFMIHPLPSKEKTDRDVFDDKAKKKIELETDLGPNARSFESTGRTPRKNLNDSGRQEKFGIKQRGHLEVTEEGNEKEDEECESGDRMSETEHNFLDQGVDNHEPNVNIQHFEASDLTVKASVHYSDDYDDDEEHSEYEFPPPPPESQSLKSEPLRPSNKGPAPQPPTTCLYERSQSAAEVANFPGPGKFGGPCGYNQHVCPTALLKYQQYQPQKIRFLQLGYNTNLRKPPENWLRMKRRYHSGPKADGTSHGARSTARHSSHHYSSHFWSSYSLSHSSWSVFSSFRYSIPSSWRARKNFFSHTHSRAGGMSNFDTSLCMCCVCCNCAKINQTNCCCCFHCVHTISSCRRSDLIRQAQRDAQTKGIFVTPTHPPPSVTPVSILKKKGAKMLTDRVSDGSQVNLINADASEDEDQFKTPPPTSAPIFAFCPKRAPTPSPEPASYPLISSEDNSARPDFEMSPDHSPIKCSGSELLTVNNNSINSIVDEDVALIPLDRGIRIM